MKPPNRNTFHDRSGQRRISALALLLLGLAAPYGSAQTVADLFDDQHVHDIRLDVDPADWETLRDNYLLDTYYPATFNWNGRTLPNIGIRSRGSGSRSPEKPNPLLGLSRCTRNAESRRPG